mmetsp:Transcript_81711/g.198349  ORF Transcript_81711/g.198349 Transcript_81711/m.198349 type:complete len:306 (+) Transcript_81711:430-1347(+)
MAASLLGGAASASASLRGGLPPSLRGGLPPAPALNLKLPLAAGSTGFKVPLLFPRCRGSLAGTADSATLVSAAILGGGSAPTFSFDSRRKKACSGEISAFGEIAALNAAAAVGAAPVALPESLELPSPLQAECALRRRPLLPMRDRGGGVSATAVALGLFSASSSFFMSSISLSSGDSSSYTKFFMAASSCSATSDIMGFTCSTTTSSIRTSASLRKEPSSSCDATLDRGDSVSKETGRGASSSFSFFFASTSQTLNSRRVLSMRIAITAQTTRHRPDKPMRLPMAAVMTGDSSVAASLAAITAV